MNFYMFIFYASLCALFWVLVDKCFVTLEYLELYIYNFYIYIYFNVVVKAVESVLVYLGSNSGFTLWLPCGFLSLSIKKEYSKTAVMSYSNAWHILSAI